MATEKTHQLLAIARRRLFANEIVTRCTKFELTMRIIELARRPRQENLAKLNAFVDICVDREGNDPEVLYARVVREIFEDSVIHWGRIVVFFAFTYNAVDIEMEKEVTNFAKEFFPDWIDE